MKRRPGRTGKRPGKAAKRVSAVKKKRTRTALRFYLTRTWWILRGAAVGAVLLGLLYGCYLGAGAVMELPALAVRIIEVEGCREITEENILRLTGVRLGAPLLKVDLKEVRRRVIRHPVVREVTVIRELPDTLRITVEERTPVAAVLGRGYTLVDREGVVLATVDFYPDRYPLISGVGVQGGSGRVLVEALPALEAFLNLTGSGLLGTDRISEVRIEGDSIQISLMGSGTMLLMGKRDIPVQMARLARFMETGVFDVRSPGYDLRFKGRVIEMPERDSGGTGT